MKGLVFPGDRRVALVEFDDPTPGAGEAVLAVKASGLCGSDLRPYRAPSNPNVSPSSLTIRGHEPCGVVVAVGSGVSPGVAQVGDRMMVHHYHGCSTCAHCRTGWPQLCAPATRTTYSANAHGSHAPFMKVRADTLIPLNDALSFEAGAAIACGTGTAWGALERLGLKGGETIAVFGQGPVGLSATLLASKMGARVVAVDIDDQRLTLSRQFGAECVVNPNHEDAVDAIRQFTRGSGVPACMETSGASNAVDAAVQCAATWGRVCFVGLGASVSFNPRAVLDRQLTLLTSYSMSSVGQAACADFVVQRGIDLDALFTDRWALHQAAEAYSKFDTQAHGKGVIVF